ncbi:MAG: Ig-like domain-containing protein, partial [Candidatus Thermoplasmatota archaeon]|nr:Ig-like domain-containing protein [Candidatus Thermoplasmatota archaeon]
YTSISPSLPAISIMSPSFSNSYTSNVTFKISVSGSDIAYTQVFLSGSMIYNSTSSSISFAYNTSKLPDGSYNVTVKTMQNDGSASYNYTVLNVNNSLNNLSNKLSSDTSSISMIAYIGIALGVVGTVLGIAALLIRRKK